MKKERDTMHAQIENMCSSYKLPNMFLEEFYDHNIKTTNAKNNCHVQNAYSVPDNVLNVLSILSI